MSFKEQLVTLKDNWLIIALIGIVILLVVGGGSITRSFGAVSMSESSMDASYMKGGYSGYAPAYDQGFAPEEQERKIVKTANLASEVERGRFSAAEEQLRSVVTASDSYLLNQNANTYGTGRNEYRQGSYSIKVEAGKYESVVMQLRNIGKVTGFSENSVDITGSYVNNEIEIAAEKERLRRYNQLYDQSSIVQDRMQLTNQIFEQERKIKYLEDRLENSDLQVSYSTVIFSLSEKRSDYADIAWVKISDLVKTLVASTKSLLYLLFAVLPYTVAIFLVWLVVHYLRKRH